MPAKKAPAKKAPATGKAALAAAFKKDVLSLGADFPCERSLAVARELHENHGEAFVASLKKHLTGSIPISMLEKVIAVESAGGTVQVKARKSFKDKAE
jgi:hypothetical protein